MARAVADTGVGLGGGGGGARGGAGWGARAVADTGVGLGGGGGGARGGAGRGGGRARRGVAPQARPGGRRAGARGKFDFHRPFAPQYRFGIHSSSPLSGERHHLGPSVTMDARSSSTVSKESRGT